MKKHNDIAISEYLLYAAGVAALCLLAFVAQIPLVAIFLFFVFAAYLKVLSLKFEEKRYNFLSLSFLFLLGVAAAVFLKDYTTLSPYCTLHAEDCITVVLNELDRRTAGWS